MVHSNMLEEGILAFEHKHDREAIALFSACLSENPHNLVAKAYLSTLGKLYLKKRWTAMPETLEVIHSTPNYYNPESFLGRYLQLHFVIPSLEHRKNLKKFKTSDPKARRSLEILLKEFQKMLPFYKEDFCKNTKELNKLFEKIEKKYYTFIDFDAINIINKDLISSISAYKEEVLHFVEAKLYYDLLQFGFLESYQFFHENKEKASRFFSYLALREKEKNKEEIIQQLLDLYAEQSSLNESDLHFSLSIFYSETIENKTIYEKTKHFNLELNVLQYYACLGHEIALRKLIDFAKTMRRQSDLADLTYFAQTIGIEIEEN